MNNLERWEKLARPPASALKTIQAGRLKGKSDINPQWRYKAMTETYGPCGEGWKFDVVRLWTEPGPDGQVFAFAHVNLYTLTTPDIADVWSAPIPGIGGHFLIEQESRGLHANDEAYKMAVTDALGTAMKMLGVAADVYAGLWDGSKYKEPGSRWEGHAAPDTTKTQATTAPPPAFRQHAELQAFVIPTKCEKCGGELWDNREKKASGKFSAKSPDFSCKDKACGWVKWPPKEQKPSAPPPQREPGEEAGFDPNDDVPW